MVPLRVDAPRSRITREQSLPVRTGRPHLVLKDLTQEEPVCEPITPRRRARRSPLQKLETLTLGASAAAVALFFAVSGISSLVSSVRQSYSGQTSSAVVIISKNVSRGDTLTSLAKRYGNPQTYLPMREEQIARINHLSGAVPLVPGQRLRIPVTSPTVIAEIERAHRAVASR